MGPRTGQITRDPCSNRKSVLVANTQTHQLKIFSEKPTQVVRPKVESLGSLPGVLRAFHQVTGWSLQHKSGRAPNQSDDLTWSTPVTPGVGAPLGHLRLQPVDSSSTSAGSPIIGSPIELDLAKTLASAISGMLGELTETRFALWQREAELAAGVPVAPHSEGEEHLAARLEAVLKGGAEAVDCHAAALYLLDEDTTELKIRSSWGLPQDRFTQSARPLRGAVADLEALLGHVVVLDEPSSMASWRVPEDFPTAVCIPVSTPTTLLGTLWIFCNDRRDFNDRQTNILEIVAGRVAADLEREMLMREGIDEAKLRRQLAAAERLQRGQLPTIAPLLDAWDVAGFTSHSGEVGREFYDWFCLPDGLLAVAVGGAKGQGLPAAMTAGALKAALRAHGRYHRQAQHAVEPLNLTLWTGSAGDQRASLCFGLIETATGRMDCAVAGRPGMLLIRSDGWQSLGQECPLLGEGPETDFGSFGQELEPGDALVILSEGLRDSLNRPEFPLSEAGLAENLVGKTNLSADKMVTLVREMLATPSTNPDPIPDRHDQTVLVIKRTGA